MSNAKDDNLYSEAFDFEEEGDAFGELIAKLPSRADAPAPEPYQPPPHPQSEELDERLTQDAEVQDVGPQELDSHPDPGPDSKGQGLLAKVAARWRFAAQAAKDQPEDEGTDGATGPSQPPAPAPAPPQGEQPQGEQPQASGLWEKMQARWRFAAQASKGEPSTSEEEPRPSSEPPRLATSSPADQSSRTPSADEDDDLKPPPLFAKPPSSARPDDEPRSQDDVDGDEAASGGSVMDRIRFALKASRQPESTAGADVSAPSWLRRQRKTSRAASGDPDPFASLLGPVSPTELERLQQEVRQEDALVVRLNRERERAVNFRLWGLIAGLLSLLLFVARVEGIAIWPVSRWKPSGDYLLQSLPNLSVPDWLTRWVADVGLESVLGNDVLVGALFVCGVIMPLWAAKIMADGVTEVLSGLSGLRDLGTSSISDIVVGAMAIACATAMFVALINITPLWALVIGLFWTVVRVIVTTVARALQGGGR